MARCNEELFKLLSQDTVEKTAEVELHIKRKLDDCRRINAMKPIDVSGNYTVDQYKRPANAFECKRTGCVNTGLLVLSTAGDTATYKTTDSTEFANGVITFYAYVEDTADLPVAVTFKIGDEQAMTNADVYTVEIAEVDADGFAPVVVLLDAPPTSVEGAGWTPSSAGSYIQVSADKVAGFSSFSIQDALENFELYDIIKMRCVSNLGDDQSLNTIEEECKAAQYDPNINTLPFSLTSTMVSANFLKANPLYGKGTQTTGFRPATVKKTAEAYTVGTEDYAKITLSDANQDVCASIAVQYQDDCSATILTALSIPTIIDVDAGHFLVRPNADGTTDIIFNKVHDGREFLISYPKIAEIKDHVFSTDFINDSEAKLVVPRKLDDGTEFIEVYENVLVTGFPRNITNTTSTFTWSFSVARAADGNFYHAQEIVG